MFEAWDAKELARVKRRDGPNLAENKMPMGFRKKMYTRSDEIDVLI